MAGPGALLLLSCPCACQCRCFLPVHIVLSRCAAGATGMAGPRELRCCPMHVMARGPMAAGSGRDWKRSLEAC